MSTLAFKILEDVARHQQGNPSRPVQFINEINKFPGDPIEVSLAWEELLACGLVVPRWKNPADVNGGRACDSFYVTPRGHDWLKMGGAAPSPEDPEGFLAALRTDPKLDPFVATTVAEAVWAYAHQRPVSALVCMCAAAERMVRMVDDASHTPKQAQNISQVWESLEKRLVGERKRPHVVTFLATTFTAIRDARNDVAHKGTITDLVQVRRFLLQYLDWHEAAATLRDNPLC